MTPPQQPAPLSPPPPPPTGSPATGSGSFGAVLDTVVLGSTIQQWVLAVLTGLVAFGAVMLARRVLHARARRFAERRPTGVIGLIPRLVLKTSGLVALAAAVFAASMWLNVGPRGEILVRGIVVAVLAVQALLWGQMLIDFALAEFLRRRAVAAGLPEPDGATLASAGILRVMAVIVLYAGVVLIGLDNLGIKVTAMIAGLGIGGIAVALAAQNILGDLFGSLSIVLDKPFVVGDFIIVGDKLGTVERIGLKTTRVKALSGEQLVFANSDLLSSRIQNYKRMNDRRVVFNLHIPHQTPAETIERIPPVLKDAVLRAGGVRFDRAHFKAIGPHSLEFEVVYFVESPDFNVYMDKQQAINLFIFRRFAEMEVPFAYPTQTLYVADGPLRVRAHAAAHGDGEADGQAGRPTRSAAG